MKIVKSFSLIGNLKAAQISKQTPIFFAPTFYLETKKDKHPFQTEGQICLHFFYLGGGIDKNKKMKFKKMVSNFILF